MASWQFNTHRERFITILYAKDMLQLLLLPFKIFIIIDVDKGFCSIFLRTITFCFPFVISGETGMNREDCFKTYNFPKLTFLCLPKLCCWWCCISAAHNDALNLAVFLL